jgi:hypothetical protein
MLSLYLLLGGGSGFSYGMMKYYSLYSLILGFYELFKKLGVPSLEI